MLALAVMVCGLLRRREEWRGHLGLVQCAEQWPTVQQGAAKCNLRGVQERV